MIVKTVETQDMIQVQQQLQAKNLINAGKDAVQPLLNPSVGPSSQNNPGMAPVAYSSPVPVATPAPTTAPAPVAVPDPTQNRLYPNQTGWIASCFVTAERPAY